MGGKEQINQESGNLKIPPASPISFYRYRQVWYEKVT